MRLSWLELYELAELDFKWLFLHALGGTCLKEAVASFEHIHFVINRHLEYMAGLLDPHLLTVRHIFGRLYHRRLRTTFHELFELSYRDFWGPILPLVEILL